MSKQQYILILEAAERRFADYGYNKTTMAEIASDCRMSVGNLYRHFPNKSEIAAASVASNLQKKLECGQQAADQTTHVFEKMTAFLCARLQFSHRFFSDHRHLHECVNIISSEHSHILIEAEEAIIEVMTVILQSGIDAEEIKPCNASRTANLIHQAMMRYNYPLSLKGNPLKDMEEDLRDTLILFYRGLQC